LYWKEYFIWRVNTISEFVEESKKITRSFSQEDSVLLSKFKTDISLIKVRRVAEHRY
jgi:acyl CoA:acetate/3-ketoacid CoA transferase alpha subunit